MSMQVSLHGILHARQGSPRVPSLELKQWGLKLYQRGKSSAKKRAVVAVTRMSDTCRW